MPKLPKIENLKPDSPIRIVTKKMTVRRLNFNLDCLALLAFLAIISL
jgi:hypothetical protein